MSEKISRRNFLRTATLGAAAAGLLAGCGNSGASSSTAAGTYTAGTYSATATGINTATPVTVTMTFSADAITDVQIDVANETKGYGADIADEMVKKILDAQSSEVDGHSGATITSDAIRKAAESCINQAKGVAVAPTEANKAETVVPDGLSVEEVESSVCELGDITPDETKVYEISGVMSGKEKYPDLSRVGYVLMLQSQGLLHDTYVYGVDMKKSMPTILNPTETMDGAILSGNCVSACDKNTTYHHLNNPVIHDLLEQHGKTLNFVGVIITNENVYLADKERSSDWSTKLAQFLELDGALVSQEGFGNPDTDLIMNCKKLEAAGIKTVIITDEYAGRDGASQSLADADPAADAVVTGGNANMVIHLPKMDKVIGHPEAANIIAGGFDGALEADGSITAELQVITGATNEMGFNKLSAR